jgi:hypothetical protein
LPRDFRAAANTKAAKGRRLIALGRPELLKPTTPRRAASGVTSMAVKDDDPALRKMIDDALAMRKRP